MLQKTVRGGDEKQWGGRKEGVCDETRMQWVGKDAGEAPVALSSSDEQETRKNRILVRWRLGMGGHARTHADGFGS